MLSLKKIKQTFVFFFFFQVLFSIFFEPLYGKQNIYPFYTWKIFHTQPDKVIDTHEIYIHQIDNEIFDPPKKGSLFVEERFPQIKTYTFVRKLHDYTADQKTKEKLIHELNRLFTIDHPHQKVVWEISLIQLNPIEYYWNKQIISEEMLGKNVSHP